MPGGTTHDAVTFLLAVPTGLLAFSATHSLSGAFIVAVLFVFGGLMFGPDLDTRSRQYSRWWIFRGIWLPYHTVFRHRSRLTHGLLLGSLIRVVYFLGVLSVAGLAIGCIWKWAEGGRPVNFSDLARFWQPFGDLVKRSLGRYFLLLVFVGVWLGAASHTLTDLAGSYLKTGKRGKLF